MADIKVAVINQSTAVTDAAVAALVPALQKQVNSDFAPAWGVPADLRFVPHGGKPNPGEWWLAILDDSDQAQALGYHDLTNEGLPMGKAFAGSDLKLGVSWTATVSHELLEMLADPNINLTVFDQTPYGCARLYAYEVCDACEDDQFGYNIDGLLVSDFVLPSWFESFRASGSTKFDFRGHIDAPFKLLTGGYIGVNDIASGLGWTQTTPSEKNPLARPPQGSRRQRRDILPDQRLSSTVSSF
jgi:hypothetical protein